MSEDFNPEEECSLCRILADIVHDECRVQARRLLCISRLKPGINVAVF